MLLNVIWIILISVTTPETLRKILFFENSQERDPYTIVLGSNLNISWNYSISLESQINYLEVYLLTYPNNVLMANMIVGDQIHVTPQINSYISNITYTSINFHQVPLSFDQSTIYIKVFFNDAVNSSVYQTEYYSSALNILVDPCGKCEHLNPQLFTTNEIKCVIVSKPAPMLKVLFEQTPSKYIISEIRQNINSNYSNETTYYISFVPKLEQHETFVKVSITNNNITWLNLSVQLKFHEQPRFECSSPTEYNGKISIQCYSFNSLNNKYSMQFRINNIDENSNELINYWKVRTEKIDNYNEISTFTVDKGWLLQTPKITVKVESKRIKTYRNLSVNFSKTSLPMGTDFYFMDQKTGQKSNFSCNNIKNGIIPICTSISDKDGKFNYRIYNPSSILHRDNEWIIIDNIDSRQFGTWSCKIFNSNGMVTVNATLTIDDVPCASHLIVHGINDYIDQVSDDIFRIHKKEYILQCDYIGFPEPTYYQFQDMFHPHRSFSSIKNQIEVSDLLNGNYSYSYWTCTVFNKRGNKQSIITTVVYEAYNSHKPRLWMAIVSISPIIIFLLIFFILILTLTVMEKKKFRQSYHQI